MKSRTRSFTGAIVAVLALPVFMGLTACLPTFPVPVGDPEKSTIDPYISGIWLSEEEEAFYVFEPYDKRTWLLTAFGLDEDLESCGDEEKLEEDTDEEEEELSYYDEMMADIAAFGTECFAVERGPGAIKVWRTKLGGEWFMTWESKGVFDAEKGFESDQWTVFHIDKSVPNQLRLEGINMEHDAWDKIDDVDEEDITRRVVEKIIRKHADEKEFYEDKAFLIYHRVLPEHFELIEDFLDEGMVD